MSVLEAAGVGVDRAGATVLDEVSVSVGEWEVVGVAGPAGAGKTALVDCLTCFARPRSGTVRFRGEDVTRLGPHRRAWLGMARTWARPMADPYLSVQDNVVAAQHLGAGYAAPSGLVGLAHLTGKERRLRDSALGILGLLGARSIRWVPAGLLPPDLAALVDLAMALATDPELLVLDDPFGRSAGGRLGYGEVLSKLREALDLSILVTARDPDDVRPVADYVYVLEGGRIVGEGPTAREGAGLPSPGPDR